jgi:competence protein ComGC
MMVAGGKPKSHEKRGFALKKLCILLIVNELILIFIWSKKKRGSRRISFK